MSQNTNLLAQASHALHANDRPTARLLLAQTLRDNPNNADAWLLLSEAVEQPAQRRDCLERVLLLDPRHQHARLRLAALSQEPPSAFAPPAPVQSTAAFSSAPTQPLSSFAAPTQPIHPAQLPPAYMAPGVPALAAIPAGQPGAPLPAQRKRPFWLAIPLGLAMIIIAGTAIIGSLKNRPQTTAAGAGNPGGAAPAAVAAKPTQPAGPEESAEERANQFFNGLYGNMTDERFYDEELVGELLEPILDEYFSPRMSRSGLMVGLKYGIGQMNLPEEQVEVMTTQIEGIRLKNLRYKTISKSATKKTLELTDGDFEFTMDGGQKMSTPIIGMTMKLEMELIDNAWYIAMLSCECATAK